MVYQINLTEAGCHQCGLVLTLVVSYPYGLWCFLGTDSETTSHFHKMSIAEAIPSEEMVASHIATNRQTSDET